jgi:hypothetical protein
MHHLGELVNNDCDGVVRWVRVSGRKLDDEV